MSRSIAALRALSEEELIREHDEHAVHTSVGTAYYEEELDRRSRERGTAAAVKLTEAGLSVPF